MPKMIKFTKIGQFRSVIKDVVYENLRDSKLTFEGTVKLHGTNAGVSYTPEEGLYVQSRNRIITVRDDNAGFAQFIAKREELFINEFKKISRPGYITTLFGEWCGGNIQKGVALNELDKMYVIFAVKFTNTLDDTTYTYERNNFNSPENSIYNSNQFPKYSIEVDFSAPNLIQNEIIALVSSVEKECPVGKYFNVSGVGEGIVFCHYNTRGVRDYIFKAKGQKHSASKVKTIAKVDVEKIASIESFLDYAVTENRLNQGIEQVFTINNLTPTKQHTGDYIKWIRQDVFSEELDTLNLNGLNPKDVISYLSLKAKNFFFTHLESL